MPASEREWARAKLVELALDGDDPRPVKGYGPNNVRRELTEAQKTAMWRWLIGFATVAWVIGMVFG